MSLDVDLETIAAQERELNFPQFDCESAWGLGSRLRGFAIERAHPVVIDIRRFGQQLFFAALAGVAPDNAEWVRRKSNVVARFLRSSYGLGLALKRDGNSLSEKFGLSDADYAAHGGSFPLSVIGAGVIGSITVSGLPQRRDHELVIEALCAELGRDYATVALPRT